MLDAQQLVNGLLKHPAHVKQEGCGAPPETLHGISDLLALVPAPAAHVVQAIGDDNLVTTTDYPHGDSKYPDAMNRFLSLPLSDTSKKKILWDNTLQLYSL